MRRPLLAALAVLLILAGLLAVPAADGHQSGPTAIDVGPEDRRQQSETVDTTIEVGPEGDRLWPYTSRSTTFEGRTLVLNAIVMQDPKTVEVLLNRQADTDWRTTDRNLRPDPVPEPFSQSEVDSDWRSAHGSVRYTYVDTGKAGEGEWLAQRFQLHVGTYLGTRHHIRAFAPSERSRWTALQAHSEYWDWFRLRHTVTDVQGTADILESEFDSMDRTSVDRRYTRESGPLSEGIVVVASLLPLLAGRRHWSSLTDRFESPARRNTTLAVFAIALAAPLAVRVAGITLEQLVPLVDPKLFVVILYPLLTVGLPFAVAGRSADLPANVAGPAAAVGLTLGFAAEFAFLGVSPPERLVWHRLLMATALGLLAAGGARFRFDDARRSLYTAAGVALWLWGVVAPLFGYV